MTNLEKAQAIIVIEKLRLIESEIFRLSHKYGVKSIDELDTLLKKGKLTERDVGEDLFMFDYLLSEKQKLENKLQKLSIKKSSVWQSLQNLLDLPKLSLRI